MSEMRQFQCFTDTAAKRGTTGRDEIIYQALWEAIVEHKLAPGARLPEDALASAFGVSRTGIRRVLQRLALERLVNLKPHCGAQIARPEPSEARDIFDARRLIEGALMPAAVVQASGAALAELETLAAQEHQAMMSHKRSEAIHLSARFHIQLMALAGNESMLEFLSQLVSRTSLIIAVYGKAQQAGCQCVHHEIIDILRRRDTQGAIDWMNAHLAAIENALDFTVDGEILPDFQRLFSGFKSASHDMCHDSRHSLRKQAS